MTWNCQPSGWLWRTLQGFKECFQEITDITGEIVSECWAHRLTYTCKNQNHAEEEGKEKRQSGCWTPFGIIAPSSPSTPLSFSRLSGWLGVSVLSGWHWIIFFAKEPQWRAAKDGVPMLMKKQTVRQRVWRRGQPQKPSSHLRRADLTLTLPLMVHPHPPLH